MSKSKSNFMRSAVLTNTKHAMANGREVTYTKEMKALDITRLLLSGFTKSEAEALVKARYK